MPESALLESSKSFENLCHNIENGAPRRINITNTCRRSYYSRTAAQRRLPRLAAADGNQRYSVLDVRVARIRELRKFKAVDP